MKGLRTIAAGWESLATQVLPKDAPPIQTTESRRAFYAGATVVLAILNDISGDDISEDAGVAMLETLQAETLAFGRAVGEGKA